MQPYLCSLFVAQSLKLKLDLGVVTQTCNLSTQEAGQEYCFDFENSLGSTVNSNPLWTTVRPYL